MTCTAPPVDTRLLVTVLEIMQVPADILYNEALNEAIAVLPSNYNFEACPPSRSPSMIVNWSPHLTGCHAPCLIANADPVAVSS